MDIEAYRVYCLSKPLVTEELPFGPDTLVFKVAGKMFALTNLESFERISLKCDPDIAVTLREQYDEVIPGYHLNKKHWNTILMTGSLNNNQIREWIDDSYHLVVATLPKSVQLEVSGQLNRK